MNFWPNWHLIKMKAYQTFSRNNRDYWKASVGKEIIGKDLYSRKYNLRFYHITKNAMTSIITSADLNWVEVEEIPQNAKTFCVLRNPFDRAISSYLHIKLLMKECNGQSPSYPYAEREIKLTYDRVKDIFFNSVEKDGINEYIKEIYQKGFFDSHHIPQVSFLNRKRRKRDRRNVDYYLNFENLNNELREITCRDLKMKHLNRKSYRKRRQRRKLRKYFEEHEENIYEIYADDWDLYNRRILKLVD